jgi:hypothetical protein
MLASLLFPSPYIPKPFLNQCAELVGSVCVRYTGASRHFCFPKEKKGNLISPFHVRFFFRLFLLSQDAKRGTTHTANELATTN